MSGTWNSGWLAGDVVTAAEFKKGVGAVFDTTLGANSTLIDITSIPAGYAHLLIACYLRTDQAFNVSLSLFRFNADTGANYDREDLTGSGATATAGEGMAQNNLIGPTAAGALAPANYFGAGLIFIPHYAGPGNKPATVLTGLSGGTATGQQQARVTGGAWRTTGAAINRVTLIPVGTNFVTGSRVTAYVMGA